MQGAVGSYPLNDVPATIRAIDCTMEETEQRRETQEYLAQPMEPIAGAFFCSEDHRSEMGMQGGFLGRELER